MATCREDPVACIDFVFLFFGEYLKDWTTLALLTTLLALLLKLRADEEAARERAYAEQMAKYDDERHGNGPAGAGPGEDRD
jgi:hypothetical protein